MRVGKKDNSLLHILGDLLSFLENRLGIFGPFSLKLVLGLALGLASLFGFAKLSEDLLANELLVFDVTVTAYVKSFGSSRVTQIMKVLSDLGSPTALTLFGIGIVLYTWLVRRHIWDTVLVPIALLGGAILNTALKILFHRQRPGWPHLVEVTGLSFPSGHAMMSYIFYGLLIYLFWLNFSAKWLNRLFTVVFGLMALAIGISRIYLGVHYPSDVLAGFAAGSFWLMACILGLRGIRYYKAHE